MVGVVGARELETVDATEQRAVALRDRASCLEDGAELLELADADRGADVVDPVVETKSGVLEPAPRVGAALVTEASQQAPLALGVRRDHPALARRDLLVRVEGEHRRRPLRADRLTLVARAEGLAGVLDQRDPVCVADGAELVQLARVAVDVDRDHRARALGDGRLDRGGREVQRPRIDVREHRRRSLVDRAVRRRDEGVRRRDDLVPRADACRDAQEMKPSGAARDGGGVRRADLLGERLLEAVDRRPEREPPRPENVGDELLFALVHPGTGERDRPDCRHGPMPRRATSRRRRATARSARCVRARCRDTPAAARA